LGQPLPLAQKSDFLISNLVNDFLEQLQGNYFDFNLSNNNTISNDFLDNLNTSRNNRFPVNGTNKIFNSTQPEVWSSLAELLNQTSPPEQNIYHEFNSDQQPISNSHSEKLDFESHVLETKNFSNQNGVHTNNSLDIKANLDIYESWGNVSALLEQHQTSKLKNTRYQQELKTEDSLINYIALEQPKAAGSSDFHINDEKIEFISHYIYRLLREKLIIEQERLGNKLVGSPLWVSNFTSSYGNYAHYSSASNTANSEIGKVGTVENMNEVYLLNSRLQVLSNEVYLAIHRRLEIEREIQGHYYTRR